MLPILHMFQLQGLNLDRGVDALAFAGVNQGGSTLREAGADRVSRFRWLNSRKPRTGVRCVAQDIQNHRCHAHFLSVPFKNLFGTCTVLLAMMLFPEYGVDCEAGRDHILPSQRSSICEQCIVG